MPSDALTLRGATLDDAPAIAEVVHTGFSSYRSFASPGWEPHALEHIGQDVEERLDGVGVRTRLALFASGRAAGFCGWTPALEAGGAREPIPGLAHLWMLFVAPECWGTGLARDLLEWAQAGMVAAGYDAARLWTPAGQARARTFYERRGWRPSGREELSSDLGLLLFEYRVELE